MELRTRTFDDERGSASLEAIVLFPGLILLFLAGLQLALLYHATEVATAAAQEGARAAAAENGHAVDGENVARDFATIKGDHALRGVTVTAERSTTEATVTVRGTSISILIGWSLTVEKSATMPDEKLTAP